MMSYEIIPDFLKSLEGRPHRQPILSDFKEGKWQGFSALETLEMVYALALSFRELGVKRGEAIGVYAPSSARWLIVDLAIMIAGGITVPIFANISHNGLAYIVNDAQMKKIFVDGEQTIEAIGESLNCFDTVIVNDLTRQREGTLSLDALIERGFAILKEGTNQIIEMLQKIKPNDIATYIYTSGSTGMPKGVELTHSNLVSQVLGAVERFPIIAGEDVALSCLPLAHIFERMVVYFYFSCGVPIYFADDVKNLANLLPMVRPSLLTVVPRLLEKVQAGILTKARMGSWFKRTIALKAFARASVKDPTQPKDFFDKIYDKLVYVKIRHALGGRLNYLISGGSALSQELCRFYLNLGVPVFQGYGMTECSPVIAASFKGANREGYVGKAFPWVIIQIAETGEILVKGPGVMRGYHCKPEETAKVIDAEGWFHTGDKGEMDTEGLLKITGRIKEIFKTSNGKYVSPVKLEQMLVSYYLIDMAMVLGENRKFVSSLIFLEPNQLKKLKEKMGKAQMADKEFVQQKEVYDKILQVIQEMNRGLDHWEQIQKFYISADVLTIEDGSLTPTMKIRRHVVSDRYKEVIEQMYEEN